MDGETIRLIVVALGAIIAGITGHVVAGAFNSQNTLATIEAARLAAEAKHAADRDIEHDRWLRDRKVEVYSKFLEELHELRLSIAEVQVGYIRDTDGLVKKARDLSLLQMRVLAPRLVYEAAQDASGSVRNLLDELMAIKARKAESTKSYDAAVEDFQEKVVLLELRVSNDLGIDVIG